MATPEDKKQGRALGGTPYLCNEPSRKGEIMAKRMTSAPVFQPEISDNPVRIEGTEDVILNAVVHAARHTLYNNGHTDYDKLALQITARLRVILGDKGVIVRDYE